MARTERLIILICWTLIAIFANEVNHTLGVMVSAILTAYKGARIVFGWRPQTAPEPPPPMLDPPGAEPGWALRMGVPTAPERKSRH